MIGTTITIAMIAPAIAPRRRDSRLLLSVIPNLSLFAVVSLQTLAMPNRLLYKSTNLWLVEPSGDSGG